MSTPHGPAYQWPRRGAHPQHLPKQALGLVQQHQARAVPRQLAQHQRVVRVVARLVARRPAAPQQLQRLLPARPATKAYDWTCVP